MPLPFPRFGEGNPLRNVHARREISLGAENSAEWKSLKKRPREEGNLARAREFRGNLARGREFRGMEIP